MITSGSVVAVKGQRNAPQMTVTGLHNPPAPSYQPPSMAPQAPLPATAHCIYWDEYRNEYGYLTICVNALVEV